MLNSFRIFAILAAAGFICPPSVNAQFPSIPDRIAGSVLFQSDISASAFGNPAIADSLDGTRFYLYSTQSFLISELTEGGVAVSFKLPGASHLVAAYAHKGFDLYRQQQAILGFSKLFGTVSAGIRATYISTVFGEGYRGDHHWSITPGTRLHFGRQVEMLASMKITLENDPFYRNEEARLGCIHHFSSRFSAGVEAVQTERKLSLSGVLRYRPGNRLECLAGLSGHEPGWGFGCRVVVKGVRILIAASYRSWLGFSPGLSVESPFSRP